MIVKHRKDKMSEKERQWKEKVVRMKEGEKVLQHPLIKKDSYYCMLNLKLLNK